MHFVNYLLRMVPSPSVSHNLGEVCRLKKTLYGLKQAPYAWSMKFSYVLTSLIFHPSHHNPMLFLKCASSGCILLSLYVNDMIIMGDDIDKIVVLKFDLASHFEMKGLGALWSFLGIEVASSLKGYLLSRSKYIVDILN